MGGPRIEVKSPPSTRATKGAASNQAPPQVHFQEKPSHKATSERRSTSASAPNTGATRNPQQSTKSQGKPVPSESFVPSTDFPSVGPAPGDNSAGNVTSGPGAAAAAAAEHWHTSADPTQSIGPLGGFAKPAFHPQHPFLPHQQTPTSATGQPLPQQYLNLPFAGVPHPSQYQLRAHNMTGDYSNTAPPAMGVNFQPPVPDTTYGPMNHTYIPRYDGAGFPAFHQPGMATGQPGYILAQQPPAVHAMPQQPYYMGGQNYVAAGPPGAHGFQSMPGPMGNMACGGPAVMGGAPPFVPGNPLPPGGHFPQPALHPDVPDLSGRTPQEEQLRQVQFAFANKMFEPQEFKPADDDPSRFYFVRELDGNWTQRNRFTIDHMDDCRWYVTDEGWFYAVRLPD